jgi:hypothetical protein
MNRYTYQDFLNNWFNTDYTGAIKLSYDQINSVFSKQIINSLLISAGINLLLNERVRKFLGDVFMLLYVYFIFYYFFVFILKILNFVFDTLVPYKSLSFNEYQSLIQSSFVTPQAAVSTQKGINIIPAVTTSQTGFVLEEVNSHKSVVFYGTSAVVGRSKDCEINISTFPNSEFVSRKHCRIYYDQNSGSWYIEDLKSTNGTFVNNKRVLSPTILDDNDKIKLGTIEFVFKIKT